MRHLLSVIVAAASTIALGQVAKAADLPVKAPAQPVVAPYYNWTGLHVGGHIGWGWANEDQTLVAFSPPGGQGLPIGSTLGTDRDGFLGGVQIGYNWQIQNWVLGIEGDWSWTSNDANLAVSSPIFAGTTITTHADTNWYATLTGRLGYAWDRSLLYLKGGAAWTKVSYVSASVIPGLGTFPSNEVSDTLTGWTVGVGWEQAIWDAWSLKAEYNYLNFGTRTYNFTQNILGTVGTATVDIDSNAHVVKVGFNYRFGLGRGP